MTINDNGVVRTDPLSMSRDPVMPDLEPNLPVAALVSQLRRLTATIAKLEFRMDANERRLGDPHVAMRPPPAPPFSVPYTVPVSCPLPQLTAAAPAVLRHVPHQVSTSCFTPHSLQPHTLGGQYTCQ